MLGLIKKDLLTIKGNLKSILVIFFVFIIMSFQNKSDFSFILPLICVMLFISTFSYDEYNNWNAYAITLPNGRKSVVKSKYIATIALALIATIITALISLIISITNNNFNVEETISSILGSISSVFIIQSIMYPLIFKFGVEKGRIFLFVGAFLITAVIGFIMNLIDLSSIEGMLKIFNNYWVIIIPVILVMMLFISYKISYKIYIEKEF